MSILQPKANPVRPNSGSFVPEAAGVLSWQQEMKEAVRDPANLGRLLDLPNWKQKAESWAKLAGQFPLFVPKSYIKRMQPGNIDDPLLRQVLPVADELTQKSGFVFDSVGDTAATNSPGLLQKYHGRALLITTGACAVHCRYCFRRHFPYGEVPKSPAAWKPAIKLLREDSSIHEVILSGGDPLTLVDHQLLQLARSLAEIPHLRRLRVHTRLPIILPSRVTDSLLQWLTETRLTPLVIAHTNHAQEIDREVSMALATLVEAGIPVLNQAVLLSGVNDSFTAQRDLCEMLIDNRVMPYYLHLPDRVAGTSHFAVPQKTGVEIVRRLREVLPGYAVPRLVQEIFGEKSKVFIE